MFRINRLIHFVGIGGIGMSGIAEVLLNQGFKVSGSDMRRSPATDRLEKLGAIIYEGHSKDNVGDAFVVVVSSAITAANPEKVEAERLGIPVIPRAEMLSELMRTKYGIAVAGTHGKTTTTSLVAGILVEAGFDPTIVVGGKVGALGSNAKLGQGKFLVAEADESDGSFLFLSPTLSIITNIDREHMDHYKTDANMEDAFVDFANKVPFFGATIICLDDPRIQGLLPRIKRRTVTYGLSGQADISARHIERTDGKTRFEVLVGKNPIGVAELALPGKHNVLNALAAFAVAMEVGADTKAIFKALSEFGGVDRRSQFKGEAGDVKVFDDYGHHPTEVMATLAGFKEAYDRRIVAVFQPHRYSRTKDLAERFFTAFYDADLLVVTDVYAAGEAPIEGVDGAMIAEGARKHGHRGVVYEPDFGKLAQTVAGELKPGDLVVTLGAGSVTQISEKLVELLKSR